MNERAVERVSSNFRDIPLRDVPSSHFIQPAKQLHPTAALRVHGHSHLLPFTQLHLPSNHCQLHVSLHGAFGVSSAICICTAHDGLHILRTRYGNFYYEHESQHDPRIHPATCISKHPTPSRYGLEARSSLEARSDSNSYSPGVVADKTHSGPHHTRTSAIHLE